MADWQSGQRGLVRFGITFGKEPPVEIRAGSPLRPGSIASLLFAIVLDDTMRAWLLQLPVAEPWQAAERLMAALTKTRSVLVITARQPSEFLRTRLASLGADLKHLFILDTIASSPGSTATNPDHEAVVPGPQLLELIALRAQQIVRRKAERPATTIVDNVAAFANYVTPGMLEQMAHYAPTLLTGENEQLFLCNDVPTSLMARLQAILPTRMLDANGAMSPVS